MPFRRHSSEMFSSPRNPSSTIQIFSSAEYCRRIRRRMSFSTCSADYDEPEIFVKSLNWSQGALTANNAERTPSAATPAGSIRVARRDTPATSGPEVSSFFIVVSSG